MSRMSGRMCSDIRVNSRVCDGWISLIWLLVLPRCVITIM